MVNVTAWSRSPLEAPSGFTQADTTKAWGTSPTQTSKTPPPVVKWESVPGAQWQTAHSWFELRAELQLHLFLLVSSIFGLEKASFIKMFSCFDIALDEIEGYYRGKIILTCCDAKSVRERERGERKK